MESGRHLEWRLSLHHLLLALLAAALFCISLTRVLGLDIWWHLAVGRYLLETRSFPSHDVFSFTGTSWDNKEWLFGIFVYLVQKAGGVNLMTLVKSALFTATFLVLYLLSVKRSGNRYLSLGVVLLAALACRARLAFRPEILSWLFVAVLLLLIEKFWEGKRRPLCLFPLLMLAWVNVHPLAFVGLVILAVHLVGGIARAALPAQADKNGWRRPRAGDLALLALILAASCVAFSCNPVSWRRFLSPIELMTTHSAYLASLTEAAPLPLFQFPCFAAFVLLAVFTLVMFVTGMDPADTLLIALFGTASVTMARNAPLLPVVAAPAIAFQFARFLDVHSPGVTEALAGWRRAADAAIAVLLVAVIVWAVRRPDFGLGYGGILYPEGAVKYLETAKPRGPMFNIYDWGGYLVWKLYPSYRVFMDGRGPDVYPPEVWAEYETIEGAKEGWDTALARRGVNFILASTANKLHPLIRALNESREWRLAYWDFQSMVFLRDAPANRALIDAYEYRVLDDKKVAFRGMAPAIELQIISELYNYLKAHPDSLDGRNLLAVTFLNKGMPDRAIAEYEGVAASHPKLPKIHYNLGMLYSQKGDAARAAAEYEREIAIDGAFAPAYNNLGRIHLEKGEEEKAMRCFRKAVRIDPKYVHAVNNLGLVRLESGDTKAAIVEFKKALDIDPAYEAAAKNLALAQEMAQKPAETCNRLGQIYYSRNNLDKAELQFVKALSHNPRYTVAMGNLGVVYLRKEKPADAIRQFKRVLEISPDDEAARRNLAMAEAMAAGGGQFGAPSPADAPFGGPPPGAVFRSPAPSGGAR